MIELVNLSNASFDNEGLLGNRPGALTELLSRHALDGIEFMPCDAWDCRLHPASGIKGVHLMFWPAWLSFWREDEKALQAEFGSAANIKKYFGALTPEEWLAVWKENIGRAAACQPEYVVFHVADSPTLSIYTRQFAVSDDDVITATIELVNLIMKDLSDTCQLLFENLWWPGLTFQRPDLAVRLLEQVQHANTGFMLDTGHLMNTNLELCSEREAADYVTNVFQQLGETGKYVRGLHLHCSLSGEYTKQMMRQHVGEHRPLSWQESMDYIMHVDWHQPFQTDAVRQIVDTVQPAYLVHEFIQRSAEDWEQKICAQRHALGWE